MSEKLVYEDGNAKIILKENGIFIQTQSGNYSWKSWEGLMSHVETEQNFKKLFAKCHDFYKDNIDEYTMV